MGVREDMAKVIVERPRLRGGAWKRPKGYKRSQSRYADDPPTREGIRIIWKYATKNFNEHLGPLRRYLDKQVGRPWNKVYSEICENLCRNSVVQDHVRDHVEDYVVRHVILINGTPCHGEGCRDYGQPIQNRFWQRWYVCPRTGLLRRLNRRRRPAETNPESKVVRVDDTAQCRFIAGQWHWLTLKPFPDNYHTHLCHDTDVFLRKPFEHLSKSEAQKTYGGSFYAIAIRPMSQSELRQSPVPPEWW